MKNTFKVGDRVRLVFLDGTLSPMPVDIHDLWGNEDTNRNVSFMVNGVGEEFYHTDLMRHEDDASPVIVPDGGEWYIARGSNMGWGRARSIDQAVANMKRQGGTITAYEVHRVSKWTQVTGMGSFSYPRGIEPELIKSVNSKKKKARA